MGFTRKTRFLPSYAMQIQLPKFVSSNAIIIETGFPPFVFADTMYPLFARKRPLFAFKAVTISVYSLKSRFKCVANGLLFNTDISLKIFANISIGRIKYMNDINKVCTTSIVNSHTDRKAVFP